MKIYFLNNSFRYVSPEGFKNVAVKFIAFLFKQPNRYLSFSALGIKHYFIFP